MIVDIFRKCFDCGFFCVCECLVVYWVYDDDVDNIDEDEYYEDF